MKIENNAVVNFDASLIVFIDVKVFFVIAEIKSYRKTSDPSPFKHANMWQDIWMNMFFTLLSHDSFSYVLAGQLFLTVLENIFGFNWNVIIRTLWTQIISWHLGVFMECYPDRLSTNKKRVCKTHSTAVHAHTYTKSEALTKYVFLSEQWENIVVVLLFISNNNHFIYSVLVLDKFINILVSCNDV